MNTNCVEAYRSRFRRVLEYIDAHQDEELSVQRLSVVAAFSKFHFARQFSAFFGLGVHEYVQRLRLRRASYALAFRPERRILEIALASGYESHEAFTRAFKQAVGQTPSEFRENPGWEPWHCRDQDLSNLRSEHMKSEIRPEQVTIIDFPETRVAALEHHGDPRRLNESIRKFIEWRKRNHLPPKKSATFNLAYCNPAETKPEDFRFDVCAAITGEVSENPEGVIEKTIPSGRCAVLRHVGSDALLGAAAAYLYGSWLPESGEELRDFPLFFQRVTFFPDVPEHEAITDVFLPLR